MHLVTLWAQPSLEPQLDGDDSQAPSGVWAALVVAISISREPLLVSVVAEPNMSSFTETTSHEEHKRLSTHTQATLQNKHAQSTS